MTRTLWTIYQWVPGKPRENPGIIVKWSGESYLPIIWHHFRAKYLPSSQNFALPVLDTVTTKCHETKAWPINITQKNWKNTFSQNKFATPQNNRNKNYTNMFWSEILARQTSLPPHPYYCKNSHQRQEKLYEPLTPARSYNKKKSNPFSLFTTAKNIEY